MFCFPEKQSVRVLPSHTIGNILSRFLESVDAKRAELPLGHTKMSSEDSSDVEDSSDPDVNRQFFLTGE